MMLGGIGFVDVKRGLTQVPNGVPTQWDDSNSLLFLTNFDLVEASQ